jgi:hypothetical protein
LPLVADVLGPRSWRSSHDHEVPVFEIADEVVGDEVGREFVAAPEPARRKGQGNC